MVERFSYGCGDFDGISDIIMGVIVDRTKSRFGKARPWLLRICIPFAVSGVLLFSVPTSWAATPKLVYVFITYNLVSTMIYTAINVPYSALNALMTQDPYERFVLSIFRNLLATAGTLTINTFTRAFQKRNSGDGSIFPGYLRRMVSV